MLKIRRPLGRLIFNMGIAIPEKTVFLIETAPCSSGLFWKCTHLGLNKFWKKYSTQPRPHQQLQSNDVYNHDNTEIKGNVGQACSLLFSKHNEALYPME